MNPERKKSLIDDAAQISRDIEALVRQEMSNGHLSPTDSAVLQRASIFLRKTLKEELAGKEDEAPAKTEGGRRKI